MSVRVISSLDEMKKTKIFVKNQYNQTEEFFVYTDKAWINIQPSSMLLKTKEIGNFSIIILDQNKMVNNSEVIKINVNSSKGIYDLDYILIKK